MSRSAWCCRNPGCPMVHGAVLGRVTTDESLVLDAAVEHFRVFFDSGKIDIVCPSCGAVRTFRGMAVFAARVKR
jgi:hypothetical protein